MLSSKHNPYILFHTEACFLLCFQKLSDRGPDDGPGNNNTDGEAKRKSGKTKGKADTPNLDVLIQQVMEEKAQDAALRNQVRAAVSGVDPADISKASYAHWLATILPRIRDIDFDYYTFENNKLTLEYLNRARLNLPPADPSLRGQNLVNLQPRVPKMSTSDNLTVSGKKHASNKPSTQSVAPSDDSDNNDVNPAPAAPTVPEPIPGPSHQPQPSTSSAPQHEADYRIPDAGYPTTLNYSDQGYEQVSNSIPRYGNIVAVRGSISPQHYHQEDVSASQHVTYSNLTPVRLDRIEPTRRSVWDTVGPPPPTAVRQTSPETPIQVRLNRLVAECQEMAMDLTPSPRKPPLNKTPLQDEVEDPHQ